MWSGQLVDEYLRKVEIAPREMIELDGLEAIAVLVDRGLAPNRSAPWPEGLNLAKLPLPEGAPVRELGLLWPGGSSRMYLIEAVAEMPLAG
ncbi:hypothetical protein I6F07_33070 [Ensifer sp. IC4062]|nr:hypothetical protein [Ensifer sp. IC4062]MCA1444900.1 hypothetical protein [Ensifer sp. IC4062]